MTQVYDDAGLFIGEEMKMRTFTERRVNPMNVTPNDVDIRDIAHSLARQCRFNGHCAGFVSVASHCIRVSFDVMDKTGSAMLSLRGLLHDAAEAYLGDMTRPMKYSGAFATYFQAEKIAEAAIAEALHVGTLADPAIKAADDRAVRYEFDHGWEIQGSPHTDERMFLERYEHLNVWRTRAGL